MVSELKPTFQGEVQLAGWSESHNGGAKVTFFLPDASDLDAFRAMTVRKGNMAGQRLAMVLVEIGDDELPVQAEPEPAPAAPAAPKGGQLAKLAGMWCALVEFWYFMESRHQITVHNPEQAAEAVRFVCQIQSRAELDNNPEAAERFHTHIRLPFIAWQQGKR